METFKYKDIDLNNRKQYMIDGLKLMIRRPLYSFIPFLIVSLLMFHVGTNFSISSIFLIISLGVFLVPLLSFEMSYSNEHSKIPFTNFNYAENKGSLYIIKNYSVEIFISLFITFLVLSLEHFGANFNNSKEVEIGFFRKYISLTIVLLILSYGFAHLYSAIYLFNNMHIPCLNKNIKQDNILIKLALENENKNNKKIIKCLYPISFVCITAHFASIIYFKSMIIGAIVWGFISSYGVAVTYVISKDVCNDDTKIKQKKKIFNFSDENKKLFLEN